MVKTALRICHAARPARLCVRPAPLRPRAVRACSTPPPSRAPAISDDLKLFATTFARRLPVRLGPDRLSAQSQARWSFQPSQAETRHIAATSSSWPAGPTPEAAQREGQQRADHHRARIDDVVGGDGARGLGLGHGRRQEGVERHDEHAAGDRDAEQREDHQAGHRVKQEIAERRELRRRACPRPARRSGAAARTRPSRSPRPARSAPRPRSSAGG